MHTSLASCAGSCTPAIPVVDITARRRLLSEWHSRISALPPAGIRSTAGAAQLAPRCQHRAACAPSDTHAVPQAVSPSAQAQPCRQPADGRQQEQQSQHWKPCQSIHAKSGMTRSTSAAHTAPWHADGDDAHATSSTPQELADVLGIPLHAWEGMTVRAPAVAAFQPHTLSLAHEALGHALHLEPHQVSRLAEIEPCVLLQPDRAGRTARALGQVLGLQPRSLATLARSHLPMLALAPGQVPERVAALTRLLQLEGAAAAAWLRAHPSKAVPLLAQPPAAVTLKLAALRDGLGCDKQSAAVLVRHRPLLLQSSALVLRSRLFALAQAGEMPMHDVVTMAMDGDPDCQGLADLLLLSPHTLWYRFQHLAALLPHATPAFVLRLLLRCAGQGTSTADAYVRWQALQSATRADGSPWADELQACDASDLAVLLGASHVQLARLAYVTLQQRQRELGLRDVVGLSDEAFDARFVDFRAWLSAS